jgi:hypothetical protein
MAYQAKPRYEAAIQPRQPDSGTDSPGWWETRHVLEALEELHNAPREQRVGPREALRSKQGGR